MKHRDPFSDYHPLVNFLYFAVILLVNMCFMHPLFLAVSLLAGILYRDTLKGGTAAFCCKVLLPVILLTAVINPAFTHQGITVIAYLPGGNPLTLESILYGITAGLMLAGVLTWFSCCTKVLTTDKFGYLFGQTAPAFSLILSMTLRMIPRFQKQFRLINETQHSLGRGISDGSFLRRFRNGLTIFSILVTWALETAIETADSMKSRGYGLPGRTAFSIYQWESKDRTALLWLGAVTFYLICGWADGALVWKFYPALFHPAVSPFTLSFPAVFFALCLTPTILRRKEDRLWKRLQSET